MKPKPRSVDIIDACLYSLERNSRLLNAMSAARCLDIERIIEMQCDYIGAFCKLSDVMGDKVLNDDMDGMDDIERSRKYARNGIYFFQSLLHLP